MATVTTLPLAGQRTFRRALTQGGPADVLLCTVLALLLLGYHPAAEDGGIYMAALASRLQPWLFPAERGFAVAHTAHGLFLPLLVSLVRVLHLSLATVILSTYVAATAVTIAAAQALVKTLFPQPGVRRSALLLFAVSSGLPIAGTSLYLVDPYLTARSLSTPLLLFALAALLRKRWVPCSLCAVAALLFHPMMAGWAMLIFAALLAVNSSRAVRYTALLGGGILTGMALVQWLGPIDGAALRAASLSRDYWFPGQWAWFELLGLVAPPILLIGCANLPQARWLTLPVRLLATATALATSTTAVAACCFIHTANRSLLLARLQPLRMMHFTYCIFVLLLGAWLGSWQQRYFRYPRWLLIPMAAAGLLFMQRQLYSHAEHFELSDKAPANSYQQAFLWIRENTPVDALFALDADYTRSPGEDARLFRAVALRSSLPDAAKDGGIASVVPSLAAEWQIAARAQHHLAGLPDSERVRRVQPLGATWIVLPAGSVTHFTCPYRNGSAQVCRLPLQPAPVDLTGTE